MANFYGELVIRITSDTTGLKKGLTESAAATTAMGEKVGKNSRLAAQRMEHVGRQMQNIGRQMTQFVTLPVAAGFAVAGVAAYKFEDSLIKIKNLTGLTAEETKKYGDAILAMGGEVGKTPLQLADAFYFLASSGFKGKEALDALEVSAQASSAGLGDVMATADVVSSAVNAYGHANLTAAHMVDVLMKTIEVGKAEPEQLAASLGRIMPVAQGLKVPIEDLGGMIAGLTLTGLSSAEAVTSLRGTMMALTAPTKMSIEAYKEMGLTYKEVTDSIAKDGLLPTLQRLYEMVDGDRLAMRKLIPNVRALNGVLSLLGPNYEKNLEVIDKVNNAQGKLNDTFAATKETNVFKIRAAWAKLQEAAIKVGAIILPYFAQFMDWLTKLAEKFEGLSEGWKLFLLRAAATVAVLGPIIMVVGTLVNALGLLRGVVAGMNIAATLGQIVGAMKFAAASGGAGAAQMAAGFSTLAASLGPVGIGLAAVAAGAVAIWAGGKLYGWLTGTTERMEKMARAAEVLESDTSGNLKRWVKKAFSDHLVVHDGKIVWKPEVSVEPPLPKKNNLVDWVKTRAQEARNAIREANKMERIEIARGALAAAQQAARLYEGKAKFARTPKQAERFREIARQAAQEAETLGIQLSQLSGQMNNLQIKGDKLEIFAGLQDQKNTIGETAKEVEKLRALVKKSPGDIRLGLKLERKEHDLAKLKSDLEAFTKKNWQVLLEVRAEKAKARLEAIDQHLEWLGKQKPSPEVDAQIKAFESKRQTVLQRLREINGQIASPTITVNDQASGQISAITQALNNMPTEKYIKVLVTGGGIMENAYGGYYKKPTLTMVGEDGPEVILPLAKPNRMAQLIEQAGISKMVAPQTVPQRSVVSQGAGRSTARQDAASAAVVKNVNVNVVVPAGSVLIGTAKEAARVLAPHITRELELEDARRARRR